MMRAVIASILSALVLSAATLTPAEAQEKADKAKVKTYDFSGDTIDGELLKPDGDLVDTRSFASHTSLIRIRKDFIKEILKSAEDL